MRIQTLLRPEELGERIRLAREKQKLSQEQLGRLIGTDQRGVSDLERGKRRLDVIDLPKMAQALNVPLLYFYGDNLSDADLDSEVLRYFQQLPNARTRRAAVEILRVFVETIDQRASNE